MLWWDERHPAQTTLGDSWIQLGEKFFEAITAAPVPVDMRALKALKLKNSVFDPTKGRASATMTWPCGNLQPAGGTRVLEGLGGRAGQGHAVDEAYMAGWRPHPARRHGAPGTGAGRELSGDGALRGGGVLPGR